MLCTFSTLLLTLASILSGCGTVPLEQKNDDVPVAWPLPPDRPRFVYEQMLRSPADIAMVTDEASMKELFTDVPAVSTTPVFDKPGAIVARRGMIYVADMKSNSVVVFNIPFRRIFRIGVRTPGGLTGPAGLALDGDMNVYVADAKWRKVYIYDALGLFLRTVGNPQDLDRPTGVAVSRDGQRIYVVDRSFNDSNQHRIVVYDAEGKKLQEIGTRGSGDGEFNIPLQATVGADDKLYVLDSGNFRIQAFDRDGKFLSSFGAVGKEFGHCSRPRGIAVDDAGNIYVSDAGFNNFQIFNPKGELLMSIGQSSMQPKPGQYGMLSGIAVDETGRVYLVDQVFNKIEVFRPLSEEEGLQMLRKSRNSKRTGMLDDRS